jgi:hypothetical protein
MSKIEIYGFDGCKTCEIVKGQGEVLDVDMDKIYTELSIEELRTKMVYHGTPSAPLVLVDGSIFYWGNWVDILNKIKEVAGESQG